MEYFCLLDQMCNLWYYTFRAHFNRPTNYVDIKNDCPEMLVPYTILSIYVTHRSQFIIITHTQLEKMLHFPGIWSKISLQFDKISHHFFMYFFIISTKIPSSGKIFREWDFQIPHFFQACIHTSAAIAIYCYTLGLVINKFKMSLLCLYSHCS